MGNDSASRPPVVLRNVPHSAIEASQAAAGADSADVVVRCLDAGDPALVADAFEHSEVTRTTHRTCGDGEAIGRR